MTKPQKTLSDWLSSIDDPSHIKLDLHHIQAVARRLDVFPIAKKVITVAGTNGKGSCCHFLEQLAIQHQYKSAVYSSPHIQKFNERIRIDGQTVDDDQIVAAFERVEQAKQRIKLTYFEYTTLVALVIFHQAQLDIAILEVGLGGRLDAVNIVDNDCAIITSIGLDHCDYLGHTLEAILFEKMGVARAGKPLVVGANIEPRVAPLRPKNSKAYFVALNKSGCTVAEQQAAHSADDQAFSESDAQTWTLTDVHKQTQVLPKPTLTGAFQLSNAACAITAMGLLLPLSSDKIAQALTQTQLLGRTQTIQIDEQPVMIDVAHNAQAVGNLYQTVQTKAKKTPVYAIYSALKDKDVHACIQPFKSLVTDWFIYPISAEHANHRQADLATIEKALNETGINHYQVVQDFADAIKKIKDQTPGFVFAYGSFFVVSDALALVDHG